MIAEANIAITRWDIVISFTDASCGDQRSCSAPGQSSYSAATLAAAARGHCCNPGRKSQNGSEKVRKRFRIRFQAAMTAIYAFGRFRFDVAAGILFRG